MATRRNNGQHVVVGTQHRGAFVGVLEEEGGDTVVLSRARMIVYWPSEMHGLLGIATRPISPAARVSPAVDRLKLRGVIVVATATAAAASSWESEPWRLSPATIRPALPVNYERNVG